MNKQGSIIDIVFLIVILFALSLFIIIGYKIMDTINDEFQTKSDLSTTAKGHISDLEGRFVNLFDGIFITIMIFLTIIIAVGVYFLNLHPIFYVPAILIAIFVIIMAGVFGNAYNEITESTDIKTEADKFTLIPFIFENFVVFITIISFLIIIVMYAKQRISE